MRCGFVVPAIVAVWIGGGFGVGSIAGDVLELSRPLNLAALNDVQSGVGISIALGRPELHVPTAYAVHTGSLKRPYEYCVVRDYNCAMLNALGTVEHGASAAVGAVGMVIGGAREPDSIVYQSFDKTRPM